MTRAEQEKRMEKGNRHVRTQVEFRMRLERDEECGVGRKLKGYEGQT